MWNKRMVVFLSAQTLLDGHRACGRDVEGHAMYVLECHVYFGRKQGE